MFRQVLRANTLLNSRCFSSNATNLLKELRARSGAGILDCKKALEANNNDMEAAYDWLRQKGILSASKKASRVASEGLVGVAVNADNSLAAMVEVNSETDFVARNPEFQKLVGDLASTALSMRATEDAMKNNTNVQTSITNLVAKIGENIQFRRSCLMEAPKSNGGIVTAYIHNQVAPNVGQMVTLIAAEKEKDTVTNEVLKQTANEIAMHTTAMRPVYLSRSDVPAEALEKERNLLREQAAGSGKTGPVLEKMIEGRVGKFYEEQCLLEQKFVLEQKKAVGAVAKERGVRIVGFERFVRGEGIEKKQEDFAEEVAKQIKK